MRPSPGAQAANQMIMPLPDETGPAASARRTLGTFDGVFVPVVRDASPSHLANEPPFNLANELLFIDFN